MCILCVNNRQLSVPFITGSTYNVLLRWELKNRLLLFVGHIPRMMSAGCSSAGKTFGVRMCICELIGEFEFDGLNPKPQKKKKNHQYFHIMVSVYWNILSGMNIAWEGM